MADGDSRTEVLKLAVRKIVEDAVEAEVDHLEWLFEERPCATY